MNSLLLVPCVWKERALKIGLETLKYRSPQLWSILSENLRQINSLIQFEECVRKWDFIDCPCRLCKLYLPNIGFCSIYLLVMHIYKHPVLA